MELYRQSCIFCFNQIPVFLIDIIKKSFDFSRSSHKTKKMSPEQRKILILGSGYVSSPVIEYLNRDKDFIVSVGKYDHSMKPVLKHTPIANRLRSFKTGGLLKVGLCNNDGL